MTKKSSVARRRVDALSDYERSMMAQWADKWIEIGLRTGPADRHKFETAVRACYRYAGLDDPQVIVWVRSPLVLALAAPIAAEIIERIPDRLKGRAAVDGAVLAAVDDAVRGAVRDAVSGAVSSAVDGAAPTSTFAPALTPHDA